LCKASPVYHDIIETWEHEQDLDLLAAVCVAKRRGSTPVTARFSVMDAKRAGLWTKAGPWQTYLPATDAADARPRHSPSATPSPTCSRGLISVEEALDNHAGADQLPPPTIDAIAEPAPPASPSAPPRTYQLTTKRGTTTFQTDEEWLSAWAKLVRSCKAARALDKLQTARQTNQAHIAAVAAFDPEPAATLTAKLDHALSVARQDA
jgi:hypothetical protein